MAPESNIKDIPGLVEVSAETIYPHVFRNRNREVGGVLVGRKPKNKSLPLITGAIPAIAADEQRANLTFTQEAWEHVHSVIEEEFPEGEEIVGWYHSHPGFGIFLSEDDLFIHRNFFDHVAQIAVVVDPIEGTEGVFAWNGDDIAPLFTRSTTSGYETRGAADATASATRVIEVEEDYAYPAAAMPEAQAGRASVGKLVAIIGGVTAVIVAGMVGLASMGGSSGSGNSDGTAKPQTAADRKVGDIKVKADSYSAPVAKGKGPAKASGAGSSSGSPGPVVAVTPAPGPAPSPHNSAPNTPAPPAVHK